MATSESMLKNFGKLFMCIAGLHIFCVNNEGCALAINADEIQDQWPWAYITSDINETSIVGNSVLWDVIVQKLYQQSLERTSYNY